MVFVDEEMGLFIVADGVGGMPAGEIASQMVSSEIQAFFEANEVESLTDADITKMMRLAVLKANAYLMEAQHQNLQYSGMGTTVVFALIVNHILYVCNVGDSRAYLINSDGITQLSTDQTLYQEMVEHEVNPKDTTVVEFAKNVLTQHIGRYRIPEANINILALTEDDYLLLCTDGLTNSLSENEIYDIVSNGIGILQDRANLLVETAIKAGSLDDVSVALITKEDRIFV